MGKIQLLTRFYYAFIMNKIRLVNIATYVHANNIHLNLKLQASLQEGNIFDQVYWGLNYSLNLRIAKYNQFRSIISVWVGVEKNMALKCFVFQFEILRYEIQCLGKIISIKPSHDGCKIRSFLFFLWYLICKTCCQNVIW